MFCICGVLRFRGNWGLRALITISVLRVPARQGDAGALPSLPPAACTGRGDPSNQHKELSATGKPRGSTRLTILRRDDG